MVLETKTKLTTYIHRSGHKYFVIYLPKDIIRDSQFPFNHEDELLLKIAGEKLVIEKYDKNKSNNKRG